VATELKTDSWHRYMLYRAEDYTQRIFPSAAEKKAIEAGKQFTARALPEVWAKDAGLVQRVRTFLVETFHWHQRLSKNGSNLAVVQTLYEMVHGGSVVVIPEEPQRGGIGSGQLAPSAPAYRVMDAETAEWMRAWLRSIEYPPGEPILKGPYDPATRQQRLAEAKAALASADSSTPLGDAQPFELGDNANLGNVTDIAARGVSEAQEDSCFAQYERDLAECTLYAAMTGKSYDYVFCKQQAFQKYNQCRGL